MAFLLIAALGLLWLFVHRNGDLLGLASLTKRASLVVAFALQQLLMYVIAEATSVGHHFTTRSVVIAWAAIVLILTGALSRDLYQLGVGVVRSVRGGVVVRRARTLSVDEIIGLAVMAAMFVIYVLIGWWYPPANPDSMAYHLPRAEHWIQNESVAQYATNYLAQAEYAPLMEYNLAVLRLLTGGDSFDGYIQLLAAVICVLGASELAGRLGLSRRGQIFAALFVATVPTFILQVTSTTSGIFAGAVGMAALVVLTSRSSTASWAPRGAAVGLMVGLAYTAKGTVLPLIGPMIAVLVVWGASRVWPRDGGRVALRHLASFAVAAAVVAAVIVAPFAARNVAIFGGPAGELTQAVIIEDPTPASILGNVVRHGSNEFHIGDGTGPARVFSGAVLGPLDWVYHDLLGQDLADLRTTVEIYQEPFEVQDYSIASRTEDIGADPWHLILFLSSIVILAVGVVRRHCELRLPLALALAGVVGYVVFAGTIKTGTYGNRFYIPLWVALAPVVAVAMSRLPRNLVRVVALLLVVACLPQLLDNYTRPFLHPARDFTTPLEGYYGPAGLHPWAKGEAEAAARLANRIASSGCERLGIDNGWLYDLPPGTREDFSAWDDGALQNLGIWYEYSLWVGLRDAGWEGEIQHVNVVNATEELEDRDFQPCALVSQGATDNYLAAHPNWNAERFRAMTLLLPKV